MPANLDNPFGEACCDGGECNPNDRSARSCGCDPGANWVCQLHRDEQVSDEETQAMKMHEYEKFVKGRAKIPLDNLAYSFIGLGGETGECLEWFKKAVYRDDKSFDNAALLQELGDVIHYVTRIGLHKGWTLKDMMSANMEKLSKRHGLGKS